MSILLQSWSSLLETNFDATATTTNKQPPPLGSEWERLSKPFGVIFTLMTALYYGTVWMIDQHHKRWFLPDPELCPTDNPTCTRSDLIAFQNVCVVTFVALSGISLHAWHFQHRGMASSATTAGRCFGYVAQGELVSLICFTFQVWIFVASLAIPEHRTWIMLMHHVLAASVGYAALHCRYMLWYGLFFFGLSEISSVPLVFLGMAKFFPPAAGSLGDTLISTVVGPSFAATFLYYRGYMWWKMMWLFGKDVAFLVRSGEGARQRPGKEWVLWVFCLSSVPLGLLQLYWAFLIVVELSKLVLGTSSMV